MRPVQLDSARDRLQRLFAFLREFDQIRHPVVRHINQLDFTLWLDELPEHAVIERGWADPDADFVLRVGRPRLAECPRPPDALDEWLRAGWDNPAIAAAVLEERRRPPLVEGDSEQVERFEGEPTRVSAFRGW